MKHRQTASLVTRGTALALAASLWASTAVADTTFESQIAGVRTVCDSASSEACSKAVHKFLDTNNDARVSFKEVEAAQASASASVQDRTSGLTPDERVLFGLALIGMKSAGATQVFTNFDTNGDGGLAHSEMFADVRLDNRPFAVLTNDPDAVDWQALAGRFGTFGRSLVGMVPANSGK